MVKAKVKREVFKVEFKVISTEMRNHSFHLRLEFAFHRRAIIFLNDKKNETKKIAG